MDKVTRLLLLYSKLMQGEKIGKIRFCMETNSLPRTFDRDIEDIRIYLSESYDHRELIYDRQKSVYYLTSSQTKSLERMEYLFLERILLDTRILRFDEMDVLLSHLAENTDVSFSMKLHEKEAIQQYDEPIHQKAILKMHRDLVEVIETKAVIRIQYIKMNGDKVERELLPCTMKYDLGHLYLIAFLPEDHPYPAYFRLDRIHSFSILRKQKRQEKKKVIEYLQMYSKGITQMYGGDFVEILLSCKREYFEYIYDKFRQVDIIEEDPVTVQVKIYVFEDGFVKWVIGQPVDLVQVIEPDGVKEKIVKEANKILAAYTGGSKQWQEKLDLH